MRPSPNRQGDVTSVLGALLSEEYLPSLLLTLVSAFGVLMLTGIAHEQVGHVSLAYVRRLHGVNTDQGGGGRRRTRLSMPELDLRWRVHGYFLILRLRSAGRTYHRMVHAKIRVLSFAGTNVYEVQLLLVLVGSQQHVREESREHALRSSLRAKAPACAACRAHQRSPMPSNPNAD